MDKGEIMTISSRSPFCKARDQSAPATADPIGTDKYPMREQYIPWAESGHLNSHIDFIAPRTPE